MSLDNSIAPILLTAIESAQAALAKWMDPASKVEDTTVIDQVLAILDDKDLLSKIETAKGITVDNPYFHSWANSSNVISSEFVPAESVLKVSFRNGKTYNYQQVPESVWIQFKESGSKGSFVHKELRPNYECLES